MFQARFRCRARVSEGDDARRAIVKICCRLISPAAAFSLQIRHLECYKGRGRRKRTFLQANATVAHVVA
ncbi:hypothetical protein BN2497_8155 [Janthinobacterium sp. CG23_2]|nr:hypothetical protein BN2497_8155 [Janthinobacterium sp. CG23_2]CUU30475.1 hypothetical protein BN3177_8155 [Janthinobacterium sp. CG23_2]